MCVLDIMVSKPRFRSVRVPQICLPLTVLLALVGAIAALDRGTTHRAPMRSERRRLLDCAAMSSDGLHVFLSDAHLGAAAASEEATRTERLHRFLAAQEGRATTVYIVGDLFDFWFEYGTAIPRRYFDTLARLRRLRESGVELVYLNGNHDFWLGRFFDETLGIRTHDGALPLELQGHRIWLHHGDGLMGGDLGYKLLRRVIRHPASIGLYRWLHPDLGIPLARQVSHWSRGSREERVPDGDGLWRGVALPRFAEGYDTVMIGHFHHAYERREDGRAFFVLGDWMRHFTYVELAGGAFALKTWPAA
jgi:UDP-2,3-diacylglucosamine hydrolase